MIECDSDFQRHLTDIGGVNYLGDPLFRIVWGASETIEVVNEHGVYVEEPAPVQEPCWLLQQWLPPDAYGTPEFYAIIMADPVTGLPIFPYPEFGKYETMVAFKTRTYDAATGSLEIGTIPLDWELIERAMPLVLGWLEMTHLQRKSARQAQKEMEEHWKKSRMEDQFLDALPSFYGPVSHSAQLNRTALIDREMAKIEAQWSRFAPAFKKNMPRGFSQENASALKSQIKN